MSGYVIDNSRNRAVSPSASYHPNETTGAQTDAVYQRKRRRAAEVAGAQVSTGGGATGTGPPTGGSTVIRQWVYIPGADDTSPATVTVANLGNDIYHGAAFAAVGDGSRYQVFVNGQMINHGSSGSYPRWEISGSDILITNRHLSGPLGTFVGSIIIVREVS